jgi:hypothetical protein
MAPSVTYAPRKLTKSQIALITPTDKYSDGGVLTVGFDDHTSLPGTMTVGINSWGEMEEHEKSSSMLETYFTNARAGFMAASGHVLREEFRLAFEYFISI